MIRSMLAFLSTKLPPNPDNGPVPILAVDVDKETEKYIMRVRSMLKNSVGEDLPTINGSNGSLGSPG